MRFSAAYRDAPIRRKLVFITILATVSATLFAILALTAQQWFQQCNALERNLYAQATIVAANSTAALTFNDHDHEAARQTLASLAAIGNIEFAELFDKTGKELAVYVRPGATMPPHQHHAAEGARNIYTMTSLEIVVPVDFEQQQISMIHVRSSMAPVYEALAWGLLLMIVAAAGGALLVAVILVLRLLPTITDPLQYLVGLMGTVSRDQNYSLRAELHSQDEVGRLAQGFNGMLAQIQIQADALAQQRQHLEDEVAQRIADLNEGNRQLGKELTERKAAEQELQVANEQLSILLDSLPIAVYRCRAEGDYAAIYMSHNVGLFTGYTSADFIEKSDLWLKRIHPDDADRVAAEMTVLFEKGKHTYEYRWQHADGSYRWILDSLKLIRPEDGSPPYLVGMWQDITERKQVEERIRESEARYRGIFEYASDIIYLLTPEGTFNSLNSAFQRLTGWPVEEWLGKSFAPIIHPDDLPRAMEVFRNTLAGQFTPVFELRIARKSGGYFDSELSIVPVGPGSEIAAIGIARDITERKLAEAEIRKQQELTSLIIETIPMRVFWKDSDLRYLGCNTQFAKDAGMPDPEAMIGKTDFDMGWKDQAALYQADDRRVMDTNTPKLSYDEPQTTPDGGQIWLRTSKAPLRNEAHETIGLLGVYEDITEYKQMELRMQESEQRFRTITELTTDWVWQIDKSGTYVYSGAKVHDLLGYEPDEVVGKTPFDFMPPEEATRVAEIFKDISSNQKPFSYLENINLHKDGRRVILETSGVPLVGSDGIFHGYFGTERDITERKLAAQALEESELKFRTILDSAVDGILVADGQTHQFVTANQAICNMLGYSQEEVYRLGLKDIHPVESISYVQKQFRRQLKGEIRVALNLPMQRKDGSVFFADVSSSPMTLAGHTFLIGIIHDVTERRQAEERNLRLNEELEEKVQERTLQLLAAQETLVRNEKLAVLGQVAGSVGHELRNPLGVMSNAVYFLQTVLADADETTKEYLNIIKDEIASSERIVSDLLDSVRTKPPRPETVSLKELLDRILGKCNVPPEVSVEIEIPETLPALRVDPLQIHQIFRNLIANGIDAMSEEGRLTIQASEDAVAGTIATAVQDTGCGMTDEQMDKLFQPLFTTKARGIGLGLVVVKNLAEANGGQVKVQSEPGRGSIFTVTLPMVEGNGNDHV